MRILIPIDGSPCSKSAVEFVASRTSLLKTPTEVDLINIQYPIALRPARMLGKEIVRAHHDREASELLKPPTARLKRAGANVTSRYRVGSVDEALTEALRNDPADLVVMGSHGDSGLTHLVFGSVAETIAASCKKPLLILRDGSTPKRDSLKIGIALDGSRHGVAVARFIAEHRSLMGEKPSITLIHVAPELAKLTVHGWVDRQVETGILPEQIDAMHKAAFETTFAPVHALLKRLGIEAREARLVGRDAGDEIARYAAKNKLDLLAMGSIGYGRSRFTSMGSVARRIAERNPIALLLVREASP